MTEVGFIILRYVINELTNKYWIKCVDSIRQYYPENKILIIDDNSNYDKMYKIIEIKGGINKDLYNRKISPNVVKKFCKILKKYSFVYLP